MAVGDLPAGYTLDAPPTNSAIPEGYTLDTPTQPSQSGEFVKGIHRGITETGAALSFLPDVAEAEINKAANIFDAQKIKQDALDYQAKIKASQQQYPAAVPELKDIHGLGTAAKYAAGQAGELAPGLVAAAIPGVGAGELAASSVAKEAAMRAAQTAAEEGVSALATSAGEQVSQKAAQAFIKKASIAGAAAGMGAQSIPQMYANMLNQGVDAPGMSILAGATTAGLMAVVPGMALGKVVGPELGSEILGANLLNKIGITNTLAQKVISKAAVGGLEMGGLGATAEAVNILAEHEVGLNPDMFTKENLARVTNSGLQNAIVGSMFSGALAPLEGHVKAGDDLLKNLYEGSDKEKTYAPLKLETSQPIERQPIPEGQPTPMSTADQAARIQKNAGWTQEQIDRYSEANALKAQAAVTPEQKAQVEQSAKLNDARLPPELRSKPSSLIPDELGNTTVDPALVEALHKSGLGAETLQHASKEDLAHLKDTMDYFTNMASDQNLREYFATGKSNLPPEAGEGVDPHILSKIPVFDQSLAEASYNKLMDAKFRKQAPQVTSFGPDANGHHEYKDTQGSSGRYHIDEENVPHIMDVRSPPVQKGYASGEFAKQRMDSAKALIDHLADRGHTEVKVDMRGQDTKSMLKALVDSGHLQNPRDVNGFGKDAHPSRFDIKPAARFKTEAKVWHSMQDIVDHHAIAQNLEGTEFTGKGHALKDSIVDSLKRINKELGGSQGLKFWDSLRDRLDKSPIAGAHFMNMIHVALNDSTSFVQAHETFYHEVWHAMERSGIITPKEIEMFDKNTHLLVDYMMKDGQMRNEDFDELRKTPLGREELRANAWGKMMVEQNAQGFNGAPNLFKSAFLRAKNYLQKMKYMLKGQDISSLQDMATTFAKGKSVYDMHEEAMNTMATARLRSLANQSHVQAAKDADQEFKGLLQTMLQTPSIENMAKLHEAGRKAEDARNMVTGDKGRSTALLAITSPRALAEKSPFFSLVYNHFLNIKAKTANYSNTMHQALDTWKQASPEVRGQTGALMAKMREVGLKGFMNAEGVMEFKNSDGDVIHRLYDKNLGPEKNQEINKAYESLQHTMQLEHALKEAAVKQRAFDNFKGLLPKDFKIEDIDRALQTPELNDVQRQKLTELGENLRNSELMKKSEYIPFSHIGEYSYIVKKKVTSTDPVTGKTSTRWEHEAMHSIEAGHDWPHKTGSMYNEFQRERAVKKMGELYSDKNLYRVIGKDKQLITDFSDFRNAHPFKMDYNNMHNMMDPRLLNTTLFANMVHSTHMDPDVQSRLKADLGGALAADMSLRGFGKMFKPSENLGGYSTDWDRVLHRHISGTSHLLSSWDHVQERANLTAETGRLQDEGLKKHIESYMKYVGSPSDDYQTLRTFNYMWAMGGNLSSMAVQLSTLPTMTLGQMCKYNPHVFQNMKALGKWSKTAIAYYAKGADHAALEGLVKSGRITVDQGNAIRRAEMENQLMSTSKQDIQSQHPYERESKEGTLKGKVTSMTNFMAKPVFIGEQVTRFATFMASHDIMQNPEVAQRMQKVHANDMAFQTQLATKNHLTFAENAGRYIMDQAHGVYGREGRVSAYRGLGGSLIFPFMTFPHAAIERMISEVHKQGAEGKVALAVTLGALATTSGLMGLPGASAATKLYDEYQKKFEGVEGVGSERMIYEKMANESGSPTFAKLMTYGVGRAFLGTDMGKRFGLPELPGQNVIFNALGIGGQSPTAGYGVEGSVIGSMQRAFQHYQQDDGAASILGAMVPGGVGNVFKAADMAKNGVQSGGQRPQTIITPEKISISSILQRLAGTNSDQVSSLKEAFYAEKALAGGKEFQQAWSKYEEQGGKLVADMYRAKRDGDVDQVKSLQEKLNAINVAAWQFAKEHGTVPPPAFMKNIYSNGMQKFTGETPKANKFLLQESQQVKKNTGY